MNSEEIRQKFLDFFEKRGHIILSSASLVTEDKKGVTNSTLFNSAGVQPLIPYLLKGKHPKGDRLVSFQKCLRTVDIDEVGDNTHATFFEMLGNWSIGDYFKEDAIKWSFEFLTGREEGLSLDPTRLYITVFEGNDNAPKDGESYDLWKKLIPENRIYFMGKDSNWWQAGENGPCGPDTEMFYDVTGTLGNLTKDQFVEADKNQQVVEVWNDVFMEYEKKDGKIIGKLPKKIVDTGAGLERLTAVIQEKESIFETDLFEPIISIINKMSKTGFDTKAGRIVADHIRAAVFLIADGVETTNIGRGYILRRILRRAVRYSDILGIEKGKLSKISEAVIEKYQKIYPELKEYQEKIKSEIESEEEKFRKTLDKGLKEFEKGTDAFTLFSSYGFPLELTLELAKEKGVSVDIESFREKFKKHQEISRAGSEQKFKGGLEGHSEIEVKYHTATHLLHKALRDVLGESVEQKGSNITKERLRFDFTHNAKMTDDQKKEVERIVNQKIFENLPVKNITLQREEAEKTGAFHFFGDKYGDDISIYFIGESLENCWSKEYCGGPHIKNTGELGKFKITKEEGVASGIRRIKAVLN